MVYFQFSKINKKQLTLQYFDFKLIGVILISLRTIHLLLTQEEAKLGSLILYIFANSVQFSDTKIYEM